MYNWFSKTTALVGLLAIGLASCKKDETRVTLSPGTSPVLAASATTATLTTATAANNAVTYTWTPSDFGYKAAVSYTLQFAKRGTNFASTQDFNVGPALTKTLTGAELNDIYNVFDCNISSTPSPTALDVRVKASIGDSYAASMSNMAGVTATPYQAQNMPANVWGLIGSATPGGWGSDTPMTYDFCSRSWSARLALSAGEFKFRANNAWTVNLGDEGSGDAAGSGRKLTYNAGSTPNPPNLVLATAGTYTITLDFSGSTPVYRIR